MPATPHYPKKGQDPEAAAADIGGDLSTANGRLGNDRAYYCGLRIGSGAKSCDKD